MTAGSFFADLSTEMLTPALPIFLIQALGANGSIVGLVDGIAQAIRNVIDGFSGPIADKLQSYRSLRLCNGSHSQATHGSVHDLGGSARGSYA
jgi:hypothetical protein